MSSFVPHGREVSLNRMVDTLKAAAEPTRLRILVLLSGGDLTVSDLTAVLNQSQPRVSRHLKLLLEAGLIGRYQEGSWAFFRLADTDSERELAIGLIARVGRCDPQIARDLERLAAVKARKQARASEYFASNAARWDELRALHVPDAAVEAALHRLIGTAPVQAMLDLGTGTGRILEIFAPLYRRGVGIDMSREMLAVARANLDKAGISHAQVRQGDIYAPPVDRGAFDLVVVHQVLHYLDNPALAIVEAARTMRAGARLVIVDFAQHDLEFLREQHAHIRLGFADRQIGEWLSDAGLSFESALQLDPLEGSGLTVRLWLARGRRILLAETDTLTGTESA